MILSADKGVVQHTDFSISVMKVHATRPLSACVHGSPYNSKIAWWPKLHNDAVMQQLQMMFKALLLMSLNGSCLMRNAWFKIQTPFCPLYTTCLVCYRLFMATGNLDITASYALP